jgi:hypothetical protein
MAGAEASLTGVLKVLNLPPVGKMLQLLPRKLEYLHRHIRDRFPFPSFMALNRYMQTEVRSPNAGSRRRRFLEFFGFFETFI